MLGLPQKYPNRVVTDVAFTAFSQYHWLFSEQLEGLALFYSRVNSDVKRAMAKNLQLPVKRVNAGDGINTFRCRSQTKPSLPSCKNTTGKQKSQKKKKRSFIVEKILKNGRRMSAYPREVEGKSSKMTFVNDCFERGKCAH